MNKTAFVALVLALIAPIGARALDEQPYSDLTDRYVEIENKSVQMRAAEAAKVRQLTLEQTLTAMNDGVTFGVRVSDFIRGKDISVGVADQVEPVKTEVVNGRGVILLAKSLPAHPRVYAPLIAAEAAKLMTDDMPACAERSYMRLWMPSVVAARVFQELGGDFRALPIVDGDRADAVKNAVVLRAHGADGLEAELEALAKADDLPTIPDLQSKATGPEAKALADANSRFVEFLSDEVATRNYLPR